MQIQQMRHVVAVVEHRSLAAAAMALGISQPALSKSLRRLEAYLGVKLFERTPRGVLATEFGREFVQHARAIAVEVSEAERAVGAIRDGREGRIVIGSAPSVIASVLPIATARLLKSRSGLKMTVIGGLHDRLFEWLRAGEIDVVISNLVDQPDNPDLVQETLFVDRVVVACRPGHPLLGKPVASKKVIENYRWILPATTIVTRQHLETALKSHGLAAPRLAIETNSLAFMRAMILETDCLGYLPSVTMEPGRECSGVVPAAISWLNWDRPVGLTLRGKGVLSPACRRLIAELRKVCAESFPVGRSRTALKVARGAAGKAADHHGLV
jgi:LysR family transcriptional regulator of gallate degradation